MDHHEKQAFLDGLKKFKDFVRRDPPVRQVLIRPVDTSADAQCMVQCLREPGAVPWGFELGPLPCHVAKHFEEYLNNLVDELQMDEAPALQRPAMAGEDVDREFEEIRNWVRSPFFNSCWHVYKTGTAFRG